MDDLNRLLARFDIETAATLAAVASCPDAILDRRPEVRPDSADSADSGSPGPESRVPAIRTIREQAEHLDLIRRSTAIAILGEDERYAELPRSADRSDGSDGRAPDRPPTRTPDRASWLERLREGLRIARADFGRVARADLDRTFVTPAGNRSTPRNYVEMALREEIHHRAQIYSTSKSLGHEPPPLPGAELAELGIEPGPSGSGTDAPDAVPPQAGGGSGR